MPRISLFLIAALSVGSAFSAELKLAGLFTDHTVLQRDKPVAIWGTAKGGDEVTVSFAGQQKATKATEDGGWLIKLDPMAAHGVGRDLLVQSAAEKAEAKITDVLVGDVWLCSGQSNMHFQMKSTENAEKEIAAANQPALRFFTVEHHFDRKTAKDVAGAWKPISPETAAGCSAVAYYFGRALQPKIGVPVGLIISSVGGTRIETWMQPETLVANGASFSLMDTWWKVSPEEFAKIGTAYKEYQQQRDQVHPQAVRAAKAKGEVPPPAPKAPKLRCHDCPSSLHNGMIAPLQSFAIRGGLWYQGEANSGQPAVYEKLLPAMIRDWRQIWGEKLPFLFVQLAPHQTLSPAFREAQTRIWQSTPHTGMVVTTDVGNATNIHPTRKRPVGERLALVARALSYGEKIETSGPLYKNMLIEGNRAVISFSHATNGLTAKDGALKGFTMAGADGKFLPADASIEGNNVIVTSDQITQPTAVRYGWAQVPDVNLFNQEGLPAVPFTAR